MPVTIDQILAKAQDLSTKRDVSTQAHEATLAATETVTSVTVVQQAVIDKATADYELAVSAAKGSADLAATAEGVAEADEQAVFDSLIADLTAFKQNA